MPPSQPPHSRNRGDSRTPRGEGDPDSDPDPDPGPETEADIEEVVALPADSRMAVLCGLWVAVDDGEVPLSFSALQERAVTLDRNADLLGED